VGDIEIPGSGIPFELPEIATVDREDPRYIHHLDDSMEILDSMIADWMDRIEQAQNGFSPTACTPWAPSYVPNREAVVESMRSQLEQIVDRKDNFIDAALDLVELHTLYNSDTPPRFVHLFFDMHDGTCEYAKLDIFEKALDRYTEGTYRVSLAELQSKEWLAEFAAEHPDDVIYIVYSPAKNVVLDDVTRHTAAVVEGLMGHMHPDFYREHGIEMMNAAAVEWEEPDDPNKPGIVNITPAGEAGIEDDESITCETVVDYKCVAGPFQQGDFRLN